MYLVYTPRNPNWLTWGLRVQAPCRNQKRSFTTLWSPLSESRPVQQTSPRPWLLNIQPAWYSQLSENKIRIVWFELQQQQQRWQYVDVNVEKYTYLVQKSCNSQRVRINLGEIRRSKIFVELKDILHSVVVTAYWIAPIMTQTPSTIVAQHPGSLLALTV